MSERLGGDPVIGVWSRRVLLRRAGAIVAGSVGLGLLQPRLAASDDHVIQLPISDFVDAQGTQVTYVPPVADFVGWTTSVETNPGLAASVDYAGLADRYLDGALGTTTSGSVTVRLIGGDLQRVQVILHTKNALSWAIPYDPTSTANQFGENPLVFGSRVQDLEAGDEPALGESHLQVVFDQPVGDPMPDLTPALFGNPPLVSLISLSFRASATGPLRALSGLGPYPTPGRLVISETGVLNRAHYMGATQDGFPVELIKLMRIGR